MTLEIIPKEGSEFKELLSRMATQVIQDKLDAQDMINEFCGAKPIFDYLCHYRENGVSHILTWEGLVFRYSEKRSLRNVVPSSDPDDDTMRIDASSEEGREFLDKWEKRFKGVDSRAFGKFGIPVLIKQYWHVDDKCLLVDVDRGDLCEILKNLDFNELKVIIR